MMRILFTVFVLLFALPSWGARIIENVTLSPTTVAPSATVSVSITVRGTGNGNRRRWQSTGYWSSADGFECENHENYNTNSSRTATFDITAPSSTNTHYIYFYAYKDNDCDSGQSDYYWAELTVAENSAPTNINLSNNALYEYQALANTKIGDLSAVDASTNDSHSFSLLSWNDTSYAGSCSSDFNDQWRFNISGNGLYNGNQNLTSGSYLICVGTQDSQGNKYKKNFTININALPSGANFFDIDEDEVVRHFTYDEYEIGQFLAADYGSGLNFTYSLQNSNSGTQTGSCNSGTADNYRFQILNGNTLAINSTRLLDVGNYTICVRADSSEGYSIRENYTITVTETPASANFFDITNDTVAANSAGEGDTIGQFYNVDDGASLTLSYELNYNNDDAVGSCTNTSDNWRFVLNGTSLNVSNTSGLDNLPSGTYYICVAATDQNDVTYIENFEITVEVAAQSCPNTSSFTTIHSDNFSSSSTTYTAVNFDRSVSSWPGDSILNDNEEDQSVNFYISSGVMVVEGSNGANFYGNNEYGAVLHNLSTNLYNTGAINEYSIEVDLYADSSDINNDVGVVFGYQDDRNYYLFRWTKIGTEFQGDPHGYPGSYRNLDLVRVSNGNATTLSSLSNQALRNPETIKITVNSDGVTACIDDEVSLSAAGHQPPIYQYGFFTYENEDGFYLDNLTVKCNGCQPIQCPSTSAYDLIYEDDFSSDSGNWSTNNFDRSVSVWPGQSIVNDPSEDQNIDYVVSSGQMNIEGANGANHEGNNEYGAVLHDLSTERYQPENITEYSIEVDMYAPTESSGYLNNDVGVVFGYQNDNNYYVIKWTKYGDRFANEYDYPGEYKNLDLIKVTNGVATTLDSVADYDAAYPSTIKITVNGDGIVICFDNVPVLAASAEQPPLYKYGFFSYENEEGVAFDNLSIRCNDCVQTAECPNTGAYTLIFEDDFNSTPNNNWTVQDLDRANVNVWPNDSIYSNSEIQDVYFGVSNGLMNIAGGQSNGSDNEYGLVLHDVSAEGFDDNVITTYSINTSFTSHSDQSNNNDAGVVFGYVNERNFYVLKWTKFAQNYASNTTFPGEYRALEVIKVVEGEPTQIGVEQNFYADDDIDLKITVNSDGITICVNGSNLITVPNEQPALGQIGFFSYDNDYGVSFDDFQVWCLDCNNSNTVDHYRILHPTTGLTCAVSDVTVAACADENCSSYYTEQVTATLSKTYGTNDPVQIMSVDTIKGFQDTTFAHSTAGEITFELTSLSPLPDSGTVCVTGSINGTTTDCTMTFADTGYSFDVADFKAGEQWQQVSVQVLKSDPNNQGTCIGEYVGSKDVAIDFTYLNPSEVVNSETLQFSLTGSGNATSITSGTPIEPQLNFSGADATAQFYINYDEVGELRLTISDPDAVLIAHSDTFVVYPHLLSIGMYDENDQYLGAAGNLTHYADQDFNLRITAINAKEEITHNYVPGDIELSLVMQSPADANAVTFQYGANESFSTDDTPDWISVQAQIGEDFGENGYYYANATFNNVGTFTLNARDEEYFTHDIYTGNNGAAVTAGRFTPAYFAIEDVNGVVDIVDDKPTVAIENTDGTFSYIGRTMNFPGTADDYPVFKYVAMTYKNNVASNYEFNMANFDFDEVNYLDVSTTIIPDERKNPVSVLATGRTEYPTLTMGSPATLLAPIDKFTGEVIFSLKEGFSYAKTITPIGPITMLLNLNFSIASLTDNDGIGYDATGIDTSEDEERWPVYAAYELNMSGVEARYGRLRASNASTASKEVNGTVYIPFVVEYWDPITLRYVTNTLDSTTNYSNITGDITEQKPLDPDNPVIVQDILAKAGSLVSNGTPNSGQGLYLPVVDSDDNLFDGEYLLEIKDLDDWLRVDWNGDGVINDSDNVLTTVIFGSFSGNNRIIYKRER